MFIFKKITHLNLYLQIYPKYERNRKKKGSLTDQLGV